MFPVVLVCSAFLTFQGIDWVYQTELAKTLKDHESHDLCHDTPTQIAWVAYRNGEARCFLEYKEFPHKAKGSSLE